MIKNANRFLPGVLLAAACAQAPGGADDSTSAQLRNPAISLADHHDLSAPLNLMRAPESNTNAEHEVKKLPRRFNTAQAAQAGEAVRQAAFTSIVAAPTVTHNWEGVGQGFTGPSGTFSVSGAPPDTNGDVGPNHYVQTVNQDLMIWNKSGTALYGPVPINSLFSGFGGLCQTDNDGDPIVLYDSIADRWMISQFAVTNPDPNYHQCVAISQTNDPTGAYYRYDFLYSGFNDYGKAGVWPDGYYWTYNMFAGNPQTFQGAKICAMNRSAMLTGAAATQQCFNTSTSYGGLLPADLDGSRQPPAGEPEFIVGMDANPNGLALWKFHVDWTTPANSTFTGPTVLPVAAFAEACSGGTCIPQSGTTQQLDSLADRMMFRLQYRNFGDHESLVTNHSVTAGTSTGVRWYEIRSPNATPTIFQQGTYAPDSAYRWMGSAAMDGSGGIGLGFSISSSSSVPSIHFTGRNASDAAGTMGQGEGTIQAGGGSQTATLSRWGDYSNLAVDPSDDCTFWFTTEYLAANGTFNWHTRVGSFKLSGCGATTPPANDFSITASPTSVTVTQGGSGTSTISTATTSGSAQSVSFSASGLPTGATATFNPTSVTSGSSSTLTLATSTTTPAGTYTVTVTGTATSGSHTTTVTLTVNAASGGGGGITNGGFETGNLSGWTSVGTTSVGGSAHSGSYAAVVGSTSPTNGDSSIAQTFTAPSTGGTLSFYYNVHCPDSVTYDWATATLADNTSATTTTVLAKTCSNTGAWTQVSATLTASHSYTLTLINHDDNYASDPTYTQYDDVAIAASAPPPANPIVNPGFETGSFSGWTTAGTASISTAAHTGSYAAQLGSTAATNGDSSVSQTFTAPAGSSTLTFWYNVHCPDTVTYDWATATLTAGTTTTTILAKTCNNTGTWTKVSAAVTPGTSYTLKLVNHDDNYSADPTYTQFDDVSVQ